ncbi:DUF2292 domain-containing protein [Sandaracinobacter neustonicus]|uniref:DUF2292 domain-containing protein n=1 Tax=Sandaracinobacter neustonicus TaxID=1715348 RepID=A0A501XHP9_9SPHN|nr:YezD family protein [Sandaracinobacter neustonicus]TPE60168.1 DUF2292 domain-containing protein [Sandaracinobacter neustonicus]
MVTQPLRKDSPRPEPVPDSAVSLIVEALGRVRFGDIRLTVHEGRLVQIDVTERTRFPNN